MTPRNLDLIEKKRIHTFLGFKESKREYAVKYIQKNQSFNVSI